MFSFCVFFYQLLLFVILIKFLINFLFQNTFPTVNFYLEILRYSGSDQVKQIMFKINLALCVFFAVLLSPIIISAIQINQNLSPVEVTALTNPVLIVPFPQKNSSSAGISSVQPVVLTNNSSKITKSSITPTFPKSVDSIVSSSVTLVSVINAKSSSSSSITSSVSPIQVPINKSVEYIPNSSVLLVSSIASSSTSISSVFKEEKLESTKINTSVSSSVSSISSVAILPTISSDLPKKQTNTEINKDDKKQVPEIIVEVKTAEKILEKPLEKIINVPNQAPKTELNSVIKKAVTYEDMIVENCANFGCNPSTVSRIMNCESSGNQNARNGIHIGLFQFNPETFRSFASPKFANLPNASINSGADQVYVATWMMANGYTSQWSCR